jgi:hypothetical protein
MAEVERTIALFITAARQNRDTASPDVRLEWLTHSNPWGIRYALPQEAKQREAEAQLNHTTEQQEALNFCERGVSRLEIAKIGEEARDYAYAEEFRHELRQRCATMGTALAFVLRHGARVLDGFDSGWESDPVEREATHAAVALLRAKLPKLKRRSRDWPPPSGRTGPARYKGSRGRRGKNRMVAREWANAKLKALEKVTDKARPLFLQAWRLDNPR